MTPYTGAKQKLRMVETGLKSVQNYFANTITGRLVLSGHFFLCLVGCLPIALLVFTIYIPYLRITLRTQCQKGQNGYPI